MSVGEAWKTFTMRECVQYIESALKAMKNSTLNACWRPLWPDCVRFSKGSRGVNDGEILLLAHAVGGQGFVDMTMKDVDELLADPVIDDEELYACVADNNEKREEEEDNEIDVAKLEEGLEIAERLAEYFMTHDPQTARAISFKKDLQYCVARYNEAYKLLTKQPVEPSIVDSSPSTSDDNVPKRKRCRIISDSE